MRFFNEIYERRLQRVSWYARLPQIFSQSLLAFIAVFAFSMFPACAGTLVIGDSISAQVTSWPTYYREMTGKHVMVIAQNGRTIRDFTLPNDLRAEDSLDEVFYFLGANDAFQSTRLPLLKERVMTHLRFLKDRGFKVTVILVPEFAGREVSAKKVNTILIRKAKALNMRVVDLMPVWDTVLTSDTVHPLPKLSRIIARYLI